MVQQNSGPHSNAAKVAQTCCQQSWLRKITWELLIYSLMPAASLSALSRASCFKSRFCNAKQGKSSDVERKNLGAQHPSYILVLIYFSQYFQPLKPSHEQDKIHCSAARGKVRRSKEISPDGHSWCRKMKESGLH
eukprot:1146232-Pelagomonas_calceolata.AAC.2